MTVVGIVSFVALVLVNTILFSALSGHRVDVPLGHEQDGPSRSWVINALFHARYDRTGSRLRKWLIITLLLQGALVVWVFVLQN